MSKLKEFETLARTLFPSEFVDVMLRILTLGDMNDGRRESFIDEYLEILRGNVNMMEAFRHFLSSSTSVSSISMEKRSPLYNQHVDNLPEAAKIKLAEIKQVMTARRPEWSVWDEIEALIKRFRMRGDYADLDKVLEYQKGLL
jgi:hypothetical protein